MVFAIPQGHKLLWIQYDILISTQFIDLLDRYISQLIQTQDQQLRFIEIIKNCITQMFRTNTSY